MPWYAVPLKRTFDSCFHSVLSHHATWSFLKRTTQIPANLPVPLLLRTGTLLTAGPLTGKAAVFTDDAYCLQAKTEGEPRRFAETSE